MACCIAVLGCWGATCLAWGVSRLLKSGRNVSKDWELASPDEFKDVPRICRILLACYEKDLENPVYSDRLIMSQVIKHAKYEDTDGKSPPYLVYLDHEAKDICLAIRGLNTSNLPDYKVLLDHKKGAAKFDGGFVHHGLVNSAAWVLDQEYDLICKLALNYPEYTVTLAGHSLGSGIAGMMAILMAKNDELSPIERSRLRCFCIAPARSASLNLAIRYADVINSVILQDDFLPRTSAPIELILGAAFCLPCLLCLKMVKDLVISEKSKLRDARRLYVPGRLYHVLYTEDCSCKTNDPIVKTAVPVDHRFEHVIFSRTAIDDHSIVNIEKKTGAAVEGMLDKEDLEQERLEDVASVPAGKLQIPGEQKMLRGATLKVVRTEEVMDAMRRCQSLGIHNAKDPTELLAELDAALEAEKVDERKEEEPGSAADESDIQDEHEPGDETFVAKPEAATSNGELPPVEPTLGADAEDATSEALREGTLAAEKQNEAEAEPENTNGTGGLLPEEEPDAGTPSIASATEDPADIGVDEQRSQSAKLHPASVANVNTESVRPQSVGFYSVSMDTDSRPSAASTPSKAWRRAASLARRKTETSQIPDEVVGKWGRLLDSLLEDEEIPRRKQHESKIKEKVQGLIDRQQTILRGYNLTGAS